MKFVIFSDIHGNAIALKECIKEIEQTKVDGIIWCGDYITDFPESHEVIQIIKEYSTKIKSYIISGNREQNIIDYANRKQYNIRQRKNIEYTYKALIENCQYKIFGHSHKQCNFVRDGVKYINPGSVGISTDENIGAQFDILEITDTYEKIEQYVIKYNIEEAIENLKHSAIYNDSV